MQLGRKYIRGTLAVAATSLVGSGAGSTPPVDVDTAVLTTPGSIGCQPSRRWRMRAWTWVATGR